MNILTLEQYLNEINQQIQALEFKKNEVSNLIQKGSSAGFESESGLYIQSDTKVSEAKVQFVKARRLGGPIIVTCYSTLPSTQLRCLVKQVEIGTWTTNAAGDWGAPNNYVNLMDRWEDLLPELHSPNILEQIKRELKQLECNG